MLEKINNQRVEKKVIWGQQFQTSAAPLHLLPSLKYIMYILTKQSDMDNIAITHIHTKKTDFAMYASSPNSPINLY